MHLQTWYIKHGRCISWYFEHYSHDYFHNLENEEPPIHAVTFTFTKAFLNSVCFAFILKTSFYLFIEQPECECNTLFGFAVL